MNHKPETSSPSRVAKVGAYRDDAEDLSGTSLGRYLLLRRLGQGGMGVVYEAEDHLLNRRVAVKLLLYTHRPPARLLERFFVEAQVAARLNHPNIIGIFDIGERSGTFFIVLELLNEQSLGSFLRRYGALHWQEATRIAADCCAALHEAHLVGLVHRDIKPDNILCSPAGAVKVADFGLVKELQHSNPDGMELTQEDAVVGSPQFMSPEQCRSHPVNSRSDIYSLGATYYSMLTGKPPYGFGVPMELMVHHCASPTPDPRELYPDIPDACVEILNLAMEKDPEARFRTADEMRTALEAVIEGTNKVSYAFLVPANTTRQPARQRDPAELAAALEAQHSDGATIDSVPSSDGPSADSPSDVSLDETLTEEKDDEVESSEEKRMALLEAALAMAPTALMTPPSPKMVQQRLRRGQRPAVLIAMAVLAVLVLALVGSRFGRLFSDDGNVKNGVRPTLKVGVLHSLSGPMAMVSRPVADATLLAIDDLNEQGGLLGHSIEAVVVDGKADVESFAAATERLLTRDKVQVIFGGEHPNGRRGIRQVVETYDQLLLYPGDSEGLEESPNVFYLGGVPSQRVSPALRYVVEKLGHKRFFLLGSELLHSRAISAMMHDQIRDLGGKVVGEKHVESGALDFTGTVRKIAASEPELVISTLRGDDNVSFFRAWQKRDKKLRELHVLSLSLDENILMLLDSVDLAGNYLAGSYFQVVPRKENAQFIERFHKKYGTHHVVTEAMEAAYSSVFLWAQAVRASGEFKARAVRQALRSQQYEAPSASYQFDETNHAWKAFHLVRIAPGNKLELLTSSPAPMRPELFPASRTRAQWETLYGSM